MSVAAKPSKKPGLTRDDVRLAITELDRRGHIETADLARLLLETRVSIDAVLWDKIVVGERTSGDRLLVYDPTRGKYAHQRVSSGPVDGPLGSPDRLRKIREVSTSPEQARQLHLRRWVAAVRAIGKASNSLLDIRQASWSGDEMAARLRGSHGHENADDFSLDDSY